MAAVVFLIVGTPHDHVVVITQAGDRRLILRSLRGCRGIDPDLTAKRRAARVVLAHVDILIGAATAQVVVVITPGDGEAATAKRGDVGLILATHGGFIDAKLTADRRAVASVDLGIDTGAAAVLTVRTPHHHEATTGQRHDLRLILAVCGVGIDAELGSGCGAVCIEALRIDTRAAAILTVRAPHDDEAAISGRPNV